MVLYSHRFAGFCWAFEITDVRTFKRNTLLLGLVVFLGFLTLALPDIATAQKLVTAAVIFSSAAIIAGKLNSKLRRSASLQTASSQESLASWTNAVAVFMLLFWSGLAWLVAEAVLSSFT